MKRLIIALLATATIIYSGVPAIAETAGDYEITLGTDSESGLIGNYSSILKPGETYNFPLIVDVNGAYVQLENSLLDEYKIRLENERGDEVVNDIDIVEGRSGVELEISIEDGWPNEQTDIEYNIEMTPKNSSDEVLDGNVFLVSGFAYADDEMIASLDEGDYIEIDNDAPIFTKEQLETISEINNYNKVTFSGRKFTYNVNVNGKDNTNMLYNYDSIDKILETFPEADFVFLSFPAGPQFGKGTLSVDVSDIEEDFGEDMTMYRYYEGKLTKLGSVYDEDNSLLNVTTGNLGRFIISDTDLGDSTIVEYGFGGVDNPDNNLDQDATEKPNPGTGVGYRKPNPSTGE